MKAPARFFLILFCIFYLPKKFALGAPAIFDLPELLLAIDSQTNDAQKIAAVRSFLVSQNSTWEHSENCRLANTITAQRRALEPWRTKIYFLNLENNPQSPNAVQALKVYREFEERTKEQKTWPEREKMFAQLDQIPLDPIPDCTDLPAPLDYSKISDEHNRIFVLTRIDLGRNIYDAYLKKYWTPRGRSEVYQKLIACQEEFKELLGASLFCFTTLTNELNPSLQNRALNYLQEAALLTVLLDRNPLRPCMKHSVNTFLENAEAFAAGSIFSPIHSIRDAHATQMRFSCRF